MNRKWELCWGYLEQYYSGTSNSREFITNPFQKKNLHLPEYIFWPVEEPPKE